MIERETILSPDRKYRYTLWREWAKYQGDLKIPPFDNELKPPGHSGWNPSRFVQFIGLNPSTADETKDDATIRVCRGFAQRWGFGAMCMTNLFAFRATDPNAMMAEERPVGDDNLEWVCTVAREASLIVAAWGCVGCFRDQDEVVYRQITRLVGKPLHCLMKSKTGFPRHPLRIPTDTMPIPFP